MAPKMKEQIKNHHLVQYNLKFLGISSSLSDTAGEQSPTITVSDTVPRARDNPGISNQPLWVQSLPSAIDLMKTKFGKPDKDHSFTQEASGETILFFVLKSGYLNHNDVIKVHPLIPHLILMMRRLSTYNFTWI